MQYIIINEIFLNLKSKIVPGKIKEVKGTYKVNADSFFFLTLAIGHWDW